MQVSDLTKHLKIAATSPCNMQIVHGWQPKEKTLELLRDSIYNSVPDGQTRVKKQALPNPTAIASEPVAAGTIPAFAVRGMTKAGKHCMLVCFLCERHCEPSACQSLGAAPRIIGPNRIQQQCVHTPLAGAIPGAILEDLEACDIQSFDRNGMASEPPSWMMRGCVLREFELPSGVDWSPLEVKSAYYCGYGWVMKIPYVVAQNTMQSNIMLTTLGASISPNVSVPLYSDLCDPDLDNECFGGDFGHAQDDFLSHSSSHFAPVHVDPPLLPVAGCVVVVVLSCGGAVVVWLCLHVRMYACAASKPAALPAQQGAPPGGGGAGRDCVCSFVVVLSWCCSAVVWGCVDACVYVCVCRQQACGSASAARSASRRWRRRS